MFDTNTKDKLLDGAAPQGKSIARFRYDEYTKEYETIPDDDTHIAKLLQEMKTNHKDGALRDISFREKQLKNLQTVMENNLDNMVKAIIADLQRSEFQAFMEVNGIINHIKGNLAHIREWAKDTQVDTPLPIGPGSSYIKWEPLGVICVMGAWNFPFTTTITPLLQVIAAGNGAVIKPSELSPRCSKVMTQVLTEGLDQKYYRVCQGKAKIAIGLNALPFDMFVFTGSTQKGKLCAQAAAKNLVPCVLELGGKSPVIVDDSANCNWAAKKILMGKMFNTGQICIAPDYCFIHESKVKDFIAEAKKHMKEGYNNNDNDEGGKIINEFHHKRLCSYLSDHGGQVVMGNENAHLDLNLQPTIIQNPNLESKVMQDEIFGPILPMIVYKNFNEVINHINSGDKPLAAYYFGNHKGTNCKRFLNEVSAGAIATNEVVMQVVNEHLPFGGVGGSGYGRYHGLMGYQQFSNPKSVLLKGVHDYFPFNAAIPPLTEKQQKDLMGQMKKAPPTQRFLWNMLQRVLIFITLIILAIVFRSQIFGLFQSKN